MNDQIETANEALPTEYTKLDNAVTIVVWSLAVYGAQDLTRKGISKIKQVRSNRKAEEAPEVETDATEK
jgi:hypothetical protein